jgi:hypothetical protein
MVYMADLSNKALSLLLLVAMVISVGGTLLTLSKLNEPAAAGMVTSTPTAQSNFTITSNVSIIFAVNTTNFGAGYIASGIGVFCNVSTLNAASVECLGGGWNIGSNLTIENNGNTNMNVSLNISKNASTFIGTGANFSIMTYQNETSSCTTLNTTWSTALVDVNDSITTNYGAHICTNLNFLDSQDSIKIAVALKIPSNVSVGTHTVLLTASGSDDSTY